jgi:glycosyltransferase involved in cell wall biosynthesis
VFKARPDSSTYCEGVWSIPPDAFVISLPSRMMIKDDDLHKRTGQWKASDVAIRGVAAFLSSLNDSERRKVVLAIPDRLLSDDLVLGKKLIRELGIEPNVAFIKGSAVQGLTRDELIYLYSRSAAVLDDVGAEWYGAVTVEALSCGAPVITYVSDRYMDRTFAWYPMLTARTESEVAARLSYLFNNRSAIAEIGSKSRAWVEEFHSSASATLHIQRTLLPLIASS